jgi:hypothetical protein
VNSQKESNLKNNRPGLMIEWPIGTKFVIFRASLMGGAIDFQLSNKKVKISPKVSLSGYAAEFQRSSVSPHDVRFRRCRKTTSIEGTVVIPRADEKDCINKIKG